MEKPDPATELATLLAERRYIKNRHIQEVAHHLQSFIESVIKNTIVERDQECNNERLARRTAHASEAWIGGRCKFCNEDEGKHKHDCQRPHPAHAGDDWVTKGVHQAVDAAIDRNAAHGSEHTDLLELAWGVIANAGGGDWEKESKEWVDAAVRWRDKYFNSAASALLRGEQPNAHRPPNEPAHVDDV